MLREVLSNDWITIFIVICITLLTVVKLLYSKRFNDFIWVIGNSNYNRIYARDLKYLDRFNTLLLCNQFIGIAIFAYLVYFNSVDNLKFNIIFYLKIVGVVLLFILIKFIIERIIGRLFDISELIDTYLFQKLNYKNYIGMLLIPINVILAYSANTNLYIIYGIIIFLILINFIGFLYSFKTYQKLLLSNFFYFILYLCALEIGPYIILYKLFN